MRWLLKIWIGEQVDIEVITKLSGDFEPSPHNFRTWTLKKILYTEVHNDVECTIISHIQHHKKKKDILHNMRYLMQSNPIANVVLFGI